jgi:HEAT repeat protein/GTPase SAR1 family protein
VKQSQGLVKPLQCVQDCFIQKVAMARKYGKNATTKNNVFKLVEALLALADGEIDVPGDKLKATFNVDWVKENELLVSGKIQQKRNNKTQIVDKGITKDDLWALVECLGKALELPPTKDEKNVDNAERRANAVQDVLDCLKELELLNDKRSAKNSPYWKFLLNLKHQTAEKKDNLKVIEEQWKVKFGSVTVEISHETPKPKEETINWQEICRQNLAQQQQLTTNPFTNACGMTPQLDGVYVPLAIVERQKPKPQPRNQQEEKEKETEKLIPIAEERFFEDVLRQGKSDISQGRKIAIIGEPGAGKTTRLQKIADWILEQELGLPIWIDLAELGAQSICQYLEKVWLSRCRGEVTRGDLEAQINRVWLLLDGVDEMMHTQGMQQLGKDLLRSWVQDSRVVVTCRVNVWEADRNAFSGFDVFRNLEFNAEQVTEYIRRWFAGMGDAATGESLEAKLAESENSRLKELIQNPLRLWMLCQIWDSRQGTLPDTQAKLYASFIKYIYRWKEQFIKTYTKLCGKTLSECQKLLHEGLGELAKAAIDGKSSRFRLSYRLVSEYLGERSDETSLLSLALSLGWLNRVGIDFDEPEEPVYAFYHATFQEYFAALAVEDWDYFLPRNHVNFPVVGKEYRIFAAQWKQVILLWLGRGDVADEEKQRFIGKLVNFDDGCGEWNFLSADRGFYEYHAYFLAATGIAELNHYSIFNEIVENIVKYGCSFTLFTFKVNWYLEQEYWSTFFTSIAVSARDILPQIKRNKAIAGLEKVLDKENKENAGTRCEAAYSLLEINPRNKRAFDTLVELSVNQYFVKTISTFKLALIQIKLKEITKGNEGVIDTLSSSTPKQVEETLLKVNSDHQMKIKVFVEESGHTHNKDLHEDVALVQLLGNTQNYDSRREVVEILGKIAIGNQRVIDALLELLEKTLDEDIRRRVTEILGKIAPGNERVIDALLEVLGKTREEGTRRKVAESLGKIVTENETALPKINEVISALIKLLANPKSKYEGREVAESLGKIAIFLGKIAPGNESALAKLNQVVDILEELLNNTQDYLTIWKVKDSLKEISKIVEFDYLFVRFIGWRKQLSNASHTMKYRPEFCNSGYYVFQQYYELIWTCGQNLAYPDFYRAWKGLTETSALVQTLNLAQLPQLLQTKLTETNLHQNLQLFYIDTSKFIDPNNPAADIYEQFLDRNCPGRPNGEPETLSQLKSYWNRLRRHSHKHPILIFYQDPTSPAAQGLSPTFLDALTRFDGTICLITDSPHPALQTFSPHDPDLLQSVVNWLKRVHFES